MEISQGVISKYKIKKVLKISILILLFLILSLLIFEYFRIKPLNVNFSNITSNSVTLSWSTKGSVKGSVIAFEKGNPLPILLIPLNKQKNYDSRDIEKAQIESIESIEQRVIDNEQNGLSFDDFEVDIDINKVGEYTTHHVKIKNLKPETQYSFFVGDTILFRKVNDKSGTSAIKTTTVFKNLKTPFPTYGAVLDAENKSDLAISELKPVLDGIVYLNLYDKESEKRSNIFSAPLNKEGKWYIDISNAIDIEGNDFVKMYSVEGVNMYYELEVDAGKLGNWKTMDFASVLSPSAPFIINSPDTLQDINIPGSVVKLSNNILGSLISPTSAKEGECAFSQYCVYVLEKNGLYVSADSPSDCVNNQAYIEQQLKLRMCVGGSYDSEQENTNLTCSGKGVGETASNNGKCYICEKQTQNGYYIARWVETDAYAINKDYGCDKATVSEPTPEPILETERDNNKEEMIITDIHRECKDVDGCICNWPQINPPQKHPAIKGQCCVVSGNMVVDQCPKDSNTENNQGTTIGDKIKSYLPITGKNYDGTTIKSAEKTCTDIDGCICIWNYNIKPGESTKVIENTYSCKIEEGQSYIPSGNEGPIATENTNIYLPLVIKGSCPGTTLNNGDACNYDSSIVFLKGTWNSNTCSCDKPSSVKNSNCWENQNLLIKNLIYTEAGKTYSCKGGKMVEVEMDWIKGDCALGSACQWNLQGERCLASDMKTLLYCHSSNKWEIEKKDKSSWFVISEEIVVTPKGEQCNNEVCLCKTGTDHKLTKGEYCISGAVCPSADENSICNLQGNTCKYHPADYLKDYWDCDGDIKSSMIKPSIKLLSNNLVSKAFAQGNGTQEYIIDQSTGLISGIESGVYTFEIDGTLYMFMVEEQALESNSGKILIFIDKNNNGIFDEGTDTKVSDLGSKIVISTIQKEYKYQLVQGFNFVSFPFLSVTESARTASGMLEMLNYLTNGSVYSLAKYDSTWEIVGKNGEGYYSNDFQLVPGEGYVIKVIKDIDVSLPGYPVNFESELDFAPLSLFPGWNLVGLYGSKLNIYTAKSLLQDINAYEKVNFTADIVNGWDQDIQGYEGFVLENDNGIELEYGLDFPINTLKSYFIRVQEGTGNWQPKLAE